MNNLLSKYLVFFPGHAMRGEYTFRYIKQFEKSERYSLNKIQDLQLSKVRKLLSHALLHSEHYKKMFIEHNVNPIEINSFDDLLLVPELTKDHLRYNQKEILVNNCRETLSQKTTGGSTGQAVSVLKSRYTMAKQDAAMWRALRWHGIDVGDRQARFWGVSFSTKQRFKNKIIDVLLNRIRLSAFESSDVEMGIFVKRVRQFKPQYFYGYVSMIKEFADYCSVNSVDFSGLKLKGVVTTSEPLSDSIRTYLSTVFSCPVINDYGSGETGPIAYECESGGMHLMADNLLIEIVNKDGLHAGEGESGEVIVTELNNFATPLIRYNMKDIITATNEQCSCGRGLPLIKAVEGRDRDVLRGCSGQKVHGAFLNYIAQECTDLNLGLKQYQAIQDDPASILVNVVTDKGYSQATDDLIRWRLQEKLGFDMVVRIKVVGAINRERSGKLRVVKYLV